MSESDEKWLCSRCGDDVGDSFFNAVVEGNLAWKCGSCGGRSVAPKSAVIQDPEAREDAYQARIREEMAVESELQRLAAEDAQTLVPAAQNGHLTGRALVEAIEASSQISGAPSQRHMDQYVRALILELAGRATH